MTILDLLSSKGRKVHQVAGTNGGEWHSPLLVCSGLARFQTWLYLHVGSVNGGPKLC